MSAATTAHTCLGLAGLAAQEGANRQLIASTATSGVKDPRDTSKVIICDQRVRATGAAGACTAALVRQSVTLATTVALRFEKRLCAPRGADKMPNFARLTLSEILFSNEENFTSH